MLLTDLASKSIIKSALEFAVKLPVEGKMTPTWEFSWPEHHLHCPPEIPTMCQRLARSVCKAEEVWNVAFLKGIES